MAKAEKFYALATCAHCRHVRDFLKDNGQELEPLYVDKLQEEEREKTLAEMAKYNPMLTFPTTVFSGGKVVVGFSRDKLKEAISS